jgi:oxygen-independent coproporphyrinogen-3 oxidase
LAIEKMQAAGFEYIGMDHFAKPSDSLAKARRQGVLHRNFQGYTTQPDADLIGLGVSAISRIGPTLIQNSRNLEEYDYSVNKQGSAVFRGHVSDRDDLIRHSVIMAILCQGELEFADFLETHWVEFQDYFSRELDSLSEFVEDGLLIWDDKGIRLTEHGWFFVRPIAMCFDRYTRKSGLQGSKLL